MTPPVCRFVFDRGVSAYDARLDTAELDDLQSPFREGFVAVEWGGLSLNEGGRC